MNRLDPSLISNLPPFSGISDDDLATLLDQATVSRMEKGKLVFEQGETAHSFFLLLDGTLRVVKTTPQGEQIIVRYIISGELFGLAQAMSLPVYPADAICAVDCIVLAWPNSIWAETTAKHPTFATSTYQVIGERLQDSQARIIEMATERVEQRVANVLVNLSAQTGRQTDDGILIDVPISRQDISEMTGTTLYTVSRLIAGWQDAGWVKSGRQTITIARKDKLSEVARGAG